MLTAQRGTSPDTWPMQRPDYWMTTLQEHCFCDIRCRKVYLTLVVSVLTAIVASSSVSFILSLGTVSRPITQLIHGDTQTRGWTRPFSWVTLPQYIIWRQNRFIIFVCEGLQINKGNQNQNLWQQEFAWGRLLEIKRPSKCVKDRQPYFHKNVVLVLQKNCDLDFIVRDITVTLNRCWGVEL